MTMNSLFRATTVIVVGIVASVEIAAGDSGLPDPAKWNSPTIVRIF